MSSALILRTVSSMGRLLRSFLSVRCGPIGARVWPGYSTLFIAIVTAGLHNSTGANSESGTRSGRATGQSTVPCSLLAIIALPEDHAQMALADVAEKSAPAVDARAAIDAIPRDYNFAADIFERNLAAGRASKPAYHRSARNLDLRPARGARRPLRPRAALASASAARSASCCALLDTIDWPTAFLGAIKAGVVPVPVNTLMTEDDYRFMLADSRARVLVVSEALFPKFANLIGSSPDLMHVIVSGENAHGHRRFEDLLADARLEVLYRADHARRHVLLALHLGLDRQAQGCGACARQSAAHRRSLWQRRCSA